MSKPSLQRQSESLEMPAGGIESGIDGLRKAADEMPNIDANLPYTTAMANVDVMNPMSEDVEGLTFMQAELISILGKVAKKYPKMSLAKISGGNLSSIVRKSRIKISSSEYIALTKLDEIKRNPTGPERLYVYSEELFCHLADDRRLESRDRRGRPAGRPGHGC